MFYRSLVVGDFSYCDITDFCLLFNPDSVPCHKMFIAHYEHFMNNPQAFGEPLAAFLELDDRRKQVMELSSDFLHDCYSGIDFSIGCAEHCRSA